MYEFLRRLSSAAFTDNDYCCPVFYDSDSTCVIFHKQGVFVVLQELVDWIKQIAIFMVVCETILSFSPSKTYKRYIKPFVGLIILFRIAVFLFGAVEVDWDRKVEDIFDHYEQSVSQYIKNYPVVDEEKEYKLNEDLIKIDTIRIGNIKIGDEE